MKIIAETDRLILREGMVEDAKILHRAATDTWEDLQNWMSWAFDGNEREESMHNFLQSAQNNSNEKVILGFLKKGGDFVISTGYHPCEGEEGSFETGYWVAKTHRRKGLAYEAMECVISHIFDHTKVQKIYIRHADGNDASEGLIRKLGFIKTGITHHDHIRCRDGEKLHTHHYEMKRQSYET